MPVLPHANRIGINQPQGAPGAKKGKSLGRPNVPASRPHNVGAAVTGITGASATDLFTKTAHGFVGGENVVITALTPATALDRVEGTETKYLGAKGGYFVLFVSPSTFKLCTPGGPPVDVLAAVTAMLLEKVSSSATVR